MSNVSDEEAQALADELGPTHGGAAESVVTLRDFSAPQRLGADRQSTLRKTLRKTLTGLNRILSGWLRESIEVELSEIGEVDATTIFRSETAPFCVLSFASDLPHPASAPNVTAPAGWLVWESSAAMKAAELALSGTLPEELRDEPLSDVERSIVGQILNDVAVPLAQSLEITARDARLLQDEDEMPLLTEEAEAGDTRRISVHFSVRGLGEGESTLRLYLPDPAAEDDGSLAAAGAALPQHLDPVPIELSAELGQLDVELSDLLALEVGDVLALGVPAGSPVAVRVEDKPCGTARLGKRSGNLVLRIEDFGPTADPAP